MAFQDCIKSAADQGEITPQEAARLKGLYDSLVRQHANDGPNQAPFAAKEALKAMLEADGLERKRQMALTLRITNERWQELKAFRRNRFDRNGVKVGKQQTPDVGEAAIHMLEHFGTAPYSSVRGRQNAIIGQAHMRMEGLLHTFRRHALGGDNVRILGKSLSFRHGRAKLDNLVREAFGEGTGDDAAKGLAKAWTETAEWLRRRYNAAGGHIQKLENWGLPQMHDARALRRAGRDTWKQSIRNRLDVTRMRHPLTDQPVTADDLDQVLDHVFESVTQEGWNTREAKRQRFGIGSLANQNSEHRFLVFKSADDWISYQRDFGEGDPFAAMMAYTNRMARDIAAMEILGPNPNATLEWLKQVIEKEGQKAASGGEAMLPVAGEKALDYARGRINKIDRMWSSMRGEMETPVSSRWAAGFAAVRNVITSSVLGGATLASVPGDLFTSTLARGFNGMSMFNMVPQLIGQFGLEGRRKAASAGLILETAMHTFHRQARYVGTFSGPEWSQYLSDRVLTWSGLTPWTQAARHAYGLAFMNEMAERAGKSFDDLEPAVKDLFNRWGISPSDWDGIRAARIDDGDGVPLLRGKEIADLDERLADRYLEMIDAEMEYAVPTGSIRAKTFLVSTDQPGTFWGEITRSFAQFKSFGAVFVFLNGMRYIPMIAAKDGKIAARGAAYAGALLLGTTVAGAISIQLKQLAQGRDPRAMNSKAFWGAAMLQGGGLGIFGDFMFSDVNRFGGGFPTTLAGPTVQHLWDIWTLTGGNLMEVAQGKETKAGRELVNVLRANTPGGSLWYLRLGYERLVLDQLQYLVDPKANKAFKTKQQWWKREMGQEFWWSPGQTGPARAPDMGAVVQ
jgi:hypothetical protein